MRAEEEQHHANWIIKYLNDCDANFSMPKVGEVNIAIKDLEQPFDLTVDLEIYTTQCINEIAV
jgi:ferritin